jgi:hypothetical protein
LDRIGEPLTIVRHTATGEVRIQVVGSVQSRRALFKIGTDVEEGDLIE